MTWLTIECADAEIAASCRRYLTLAGMDALPFPPYQLVLTSHAAVCQDTSGVIRQQWDTPLCLRKVVAELCMIAEQAGDAPVALTEAVMLDCQRRLLLRHGKEALQLTEKETELVQALVMAGREGISREALLQEVWRYHPEAESRTLETHLYRLRQKLQEEGVAELDIVSQQGIYYLKSALS